jgi:hypothetical protein
LWCLVNYKFRGDLRSPRILTRAAIASARDQQRSGDQWLPLTAIYRELQVSVIALNSAALLDALSVG